MDFENKLVVWVADVIIDEADRRIKEKLCKDYQISEDDFVPTENDGFQFMFCDEGGGEIKIESFPFPGGTTVDIYGEYDGDTVAVHRLVVEALFPEAN